VSQPDLYGLAHHVKLKMSQLNRTYFSVSHKFCNPTRPTMGWWVRWVDSNVFCSSNLFCIFIALQSKWIGSLTVYNNTVKVFTYFIKHYYIDSKVKIKVSTKHPNYSNIIKQLSSL